MRTHPSSHSLCVCVPTHMCVNTHPSSHPLHTCVPTHVTHMHMSIHACVCVALPSSSGSFQSSIHQKHSVFTRFYKLTMEWLLDLWLIQARTSKITTFLIIFSISAQWTTFFFLQKKTVPQWFKLKQQQQQNNNDSNSYFLQRVTITWWVGATVSPMETLLQVEFLSPS